LQLLKRMAFLREQKGVLHTGPPEKEAMAVWELNRGKNWGKGKGEN